MAIRSSEAARTDQADGQRRSPGRFTGAFRARLITPGTGSPMRWFFSGIWAFYLTYLPILMYQDRWPRRAHGGLAAMVLLAALACVVYGYQWTPLWIYVSAAAGVVLVAGPAGVRGAVFGVAGSVVCYTFFSWLSHLDLGNYFVELLPVLLIGLAMMGFRLQIALMHELARARGTVAKLAANEERLRLARDMHDLTGQSLSMITLKSDLAAKRLTRLPPSAERDAVLTELDDIARVSRQTLHDIREAVSGYRRPTLAIEVITARTALEAAAIRLDDDPAVTLRSGTFDPDAEAALAWCLREAVTNVIRHSGAKSCRVRLMQRAGEISLEVSDTGRGFGGRTGQGRDNAAARLPGDGDAQPRQAGPVSRTLLPAGQEPGAAGLEPWRAGPI